MRNFVYLIVIFSVGSFQGETEQHHYEQCNFGNMTFRKWFETISYTGSKEAETCKWIFNLPDDDEREFLFFLYIFYYPKNSKNSFLLPNATELASEILHDRNIVCRTYYKSKSAINESRLQNSIEHQCPGKPYAANSWPPQITTNYTSIKNKQKIRFGLLYRWSVYPTQNTLESTTGQQSTIGAVIVLAGLLCVVIIGLVVLFMKFRRLKKMLADSASKTKMISDVQSQYEEIGNVKTHNISGESSEKKIVDNIIYQSH